MKKNTCLIYDIQLALDSVNEIDNYVLDFYKLENDLNDVLQDYKGISKVQLDIGNFEFNEPDMFVKKLLPHIHIYLWGSKMKFIEKKLDDYLAYSFTPNNIKKYSVNDNPFELENLELFKTICYLFKTYSLKPRVLLQEEHSEIFV